MISLTKKKPKVIAVVGPTASGKTVRAVEIAREINGEIISADSRLVYRGFDIGTAKPTVEEMQGIPHYMIDIIEPEAEYSVGLYVKEAKKIISDILSRGKTPIIVGGTGLYIRVLLENYELPEVEPDKELREKLSAMTIDELREILSCHSELDSESANINDKRKLIRIIEIAKSTGLPLSDARGVGESEYDVEWVGMNFPRGELYERINTRVDKMIEQGLIDEAQKLLEKHGKIPNLLETIGYREVIEYLDGAVSLEEAIDKLKQNTRRYAKRQLTWFRKNELIFWNNYPELLKK